MISFHTSLLCDADNILPFYDHREEIILTSVERNEKKQQSLPTAESLMVPQIMTHPVPPTLLFFLIFILKTSVISLKIARFAMKGNL